jgi:mono/diheme cytochrome c family protein
MRRRTRASMATVLTLILAAGCGEDDPDPRAPATVATEEEIEPFDRRLAANLPAGVTVETAEQGRELYIVCATCHGLDARGTQLGPSLRDREWLGISGDFESIQRVIVEGVAEPEEFEIPMPAGGGGSFTPEQLRAVAAYVFALSHDAPAAGP